MAGLCHLRVDQMEREECLSRFRLAGQKAGNPLSGMRLPGEPGTQRRLIQNRHALA